MKRQPPKTTPSGEDKHGLHLARQAFERVQPALAAIAKERVEQIRLDLLSVARVARRVSKLVQRPEVRRKFEELGTKAFDIALLDELGDLSLASWYARTEADNAEMRASQIRGTTELIEQGRELKHRMLRVLAYHFANSVVVNAQLAGIRPGIGHQDLAADLSKLARLYEAHQGSLRSAGTWYRPADAELAHATADRILDQLEARAEDRWRPILDRLWTRLHAVYEEVRTAGRFVFRGDPMAKSFPSLHAATRGKRSIDELDDGGEGAEARAGPETPENAPAMAAPNAPAVTPAEPVTLPPLTNGASEIHDR